MVIEIIIDDDRGVVRGIGETIVDMIIDMTDDDREVVIGTEIIVDDDQGVMIETIVDTITEITEMVDH